MATIQGVYVALFGRPADPTGLAYFNSVTKNGADLSGIGDLSSTAEYKARFAGLSNVQIVNSVYQSLFGRDADVAGLSFFANGLASGKYNINNIAITILDGAQGTDLTTVNNKIAAANLYTAALDTTPEIVAYTGNAAADAGRAFIAGVTTTVPAQTAVDTAVANMVSTAGNASGQTFTLTTSADILTGTGGNDTFIGDNTGTNATVTAGDQINGGAGVDTFKYYLAAATGVEAAVLPQLTNVENIYYKGGVLGDAKTLDVSGIAGVTGVEIDTPSAALVANANFTVKTSATQGVTLDKINVANGGTAKVTLSGATAVTLNGNGTDSTNNGTLQVDFSSATATSASIATTGASSKVTLLNSGAKVSTLTITGTQDLTLAEGLTTLKTIDASAATGKIAVDTSSATVDAAFTFKAGAGNDTLTLSQASLQALTSGAQLAGNAGTDTISIVNTGNDITFAAKEYTALNAATGFEILQVSGKSAATVDASQLTSIKEFAVGAGTNTITKVASGSALDILAAGTQKVSGSVGVSDLTVNLGSATATAGVTNTALDVTGLTNVTVNANIKPGTVGATFDLGTLTNSDNSTFTIKGNGDVKIALAAATATGSKVDGSASTGILDITGNKANLDLTKAALADVLIGGAGNDKIHVGANGAIVTGGAGNDQFDVVKAVVGTGATSGNTETPWTTIKDFTKGDSIQFGTDFKVASAVTKVDLSGLAANSTDTQVVTALLAKGNAKGDVLWGTYNGQTYVYEDAGTAKTADAGDIAVKITGIVDLSTSTHAADQILVFA
ncbi:beta strand repeat-containing protein [Rhizobium oryzicola]|uniref:DUF4214 domain-containing protein n=1 Tax=Rhizobium oryzicola TaxID=1232668 RepID=A0ABT8SW02_9HYPH|nr:DUF4214 domain-containing protein [Rhizobium oryzicola]MDO1582511.1 DUF4214 domain-containing protein [Rhizobium oryzicola]